MKNLRLFILAAALFAAAASASAQIRVEQAWVRATVAGQQSTGAFMKITSAQPVKLVAVTTPVAATNEIHEMKMDGNVMKMRAHPDGIDIPAGKTVELKSGGYHLMMMELDQPIKAGGTVPLRLQFTDARGGKQELTVNAKVSFKDPYRQP
jgi:periplasmic copper chaperone A